LLNGALDLFSVSFKLDLLRRSPQRAAPILELISDDTLAAPFMPIEERSNRITTSFVVNDAMLVPVATFPRSFGTVIRLDFHSFKNVVKRDDSLRSLDNHADHLVAVTLLNLSTTHNPPPFNTAAHRNQAS
jgi:hypothetical protein